MTAFLLNEEVRQKLKDLKELAWREDRVIPLETLQKCAEGFDRDDPKTREGRSPYPLDQTVELPLGWMVTLSVEYQPMGLARHLSVSSPAPERVPSVETVSIVMAELGFEKNISGCAVYLEEYKCDHKAVNVVELVQEVAAC
jgi:hypothetical protein